MSKQKVSNLLKIEIKSFITKMKDDGCGNNFNEQNL